MRRNVINTPWIYHKSSLWLISLSSNWTNRITIADKNLWATSTNISNTASYWKYYQWWNNYGFAITGTPSTNSNQINIDSYWPSSYYSSSVYRTVNPRFSYSNLSYAKNLRWWTTNTTISKKWPCATWYHIPSNTELDTLINTYNSLWLYRYDGTDGLQRYLLIPKNWYRDVYASISQQWQTVAFWTATYDDSWEAYSNLWTNKVSIGRAIRPFANTPVQPDESRTVLYPTS